MNKILIKIFLCVLILFQSTVFAQSEGSDGSSFKEKMATVIFCGLGGAVIGLSTLSFYGEPQKHIGNISTGFALGLVTGSVYLLYQNTSVFDSQSLYQEVQNKENLLVAGEFSKSSSVVPYVMTFQF